jgi:hypothetical protein
MSVADLDQFVRVVVEYLIIVGGASLAAILVYLYMSD